MESMEILKDKERDELLAFTSGDASIFPARLKNLVKKCLDALESSERSAIESALAKPRSQFDVAGLRGMFPDIRLFDGFDDCVVGYSMILGQVHAIYDFDKWYEACKRKEPKLALSDILIKAREMCNDHQCPAIMFKNL